MNFAAVPYVPDGKFREALESNTDYNDEDIRCIFAHQTFTGCDMDGMISQSGDKIEKNWKLIISGHIHGHQILKKKVHYAGTPRQTSFGDSVDKTVSFFTITPTTHTEERIPIGLPPKLTFRVACSKIHKLKLPKKGDIRVNIVGTSTEIATVKSHPIVKKWESRGVKIKYTFMREDIDITQIKENIKNFSNESQSSGSVTFRNLFAKEIERNPEYKKIYHKVRA